MKVLITGATGLIGGEIVELCHKNDIAVHYLTTSKSKIENNLNYQGFYWNPEQNIIDADCFHGVDTIIHLAGATVSERWTQAYKKEIRSSRLRPTKLLSDTLKNKPHTIKQIISASAIGIYPDSLINYYDEAFDEIDNSFLASVVNEWEQVVDAFSDLHIIVSKIRIGLVLSNKGGVLTQMSKPIRFGLGAAFGNGKQWQSWIHISDLADMFIYVVKKRLSGVYNAVAPNPVTNKDLIKTIAKVLGKPLLLPNIPKGFMKLVLGEMHMLLFLSQRVSSKKIEDTGFVFKFHHLQPALEDLI